QPPPTTPPPATPPAAAPPATPAAAPVAITDADLKGIEAPKAEKRAAGDPDGGLTGTVSDVAVADPITDKTPKAKGLTIAGVGNLGGIPPLSVEYTMKLFDKPFGLFGQNGYFLMHHGTYDVGVMVIFLFQMVFMDTALTIVTGSAAERWKFVAFLASSFMLGAFIYPLFANWAWGGGWLANLGANFGLGKGYVDFAGSGVVHSVGGLM